MFNLVEESLKANEIVVKQDCIDISSNIIESCKNVPVEIDGITEGVIGKIPVVLAQLNVQLNVSAKIDFPEIALEIKDITQRLMITQCRLIQETNTLFIKGLVRKNINYSTIERRPTTEEICGDIRHCTVDIPFVCTTPVKFNGLPPAKIIPTTSKKFEYFKKQDLPNDYAEGDELLSMDTSEFNQTSTEYYNDLPYCELVQSKIIDVNEYLNRKIIKDGPLEEGVFRKLEEKMVINLVLIILQKRLVKIN